MKRNEKSVFVVAIGLFMVAVAFFGVPKAQASTGCFTDTNGNWAETFICWLKDNGISSGYPDGTYHPDSSITRAEMAVLLKRLANIPPETGDIYINVPPDSWEEYATTNSSTTLNHYATNTIITFSSTGSKFFQVQAPFPSTLYGRSLILRGIEFCYTANATAYLSDLWIYQYRNTNSGDGTAVTSYLSTTNYSDQACRVFSLPSPVQVLPQDYIDILISLTVTDAVSGFHLGRTTLIMAPSTSVPALLPLGPETLLQPMNNNLPVFDPQATP